MSIYPQDSIQAKLVGEDIDKFEYVMKYYDKKAGIEISRSAVIKRLIRDKYDELKKEE